MLNYHQRFSSVLHVSLDKANLCQLPGLTNLPRGSWLSHIGLAQVTLGSSVNLPVLHPSLIFLSRAIDIFHDPTRMV
jgi:hypothetical protein